MYVLHDGPKVVKQMIWCIPPETRKCLSLFSPSKIYRNYTISTGPCSFGYEIFLNRVYITLKIPKTIDVENLGHRIFFPEP